MPAVQDTNPPFKWAYFDINNNQVSNYVFNTRWKCEQAFTGIKKPDRGSRLTLKGDGVGIEQKLWCADDIEFTTPGSGLILTSPNGTRYILTVLDDGSIAPAGIPPAINNPGGGGTIPPPPPDV